MFPSSLLLLSFPCPSPLFLLLPPSFLYFFSSPLFSRSLSPLLSPCFISLHPSLSALSLLFYLRTSSLSSLLFLFFLSSFISPLHFSPDFSLSSFSSLLLHLSLLFSSCSFSPLSSPHFISLLPSLPALSLLFYLPTSFHSSLLSLLSSLHSPTPLPLSPHRFLKSPLPPPLLMDSPGEKSSQPATASAVPHSFPLVA